MTSDSIPRLLQQPRACPSFAFVFRLCLHTPFLHKILATSKTCHALNRSVPLRSAPPCPAHWHPCSCQSMCRVTVSLHLSVTCMSVCLFYVTPGERISSPPLATLASSSLLSCKRAFLLSCFPANLLPGLLKFYLAEKNEAGGRRRERGAPSEGCPATDGWIFGFATCTWITSLILMRTCLSRSRIGGWGSTHCTCQGTKRKFINSLAL